jgi:hypothetical protein
MKKETCEFTLQDLVPIAIVFVVVTIVLSYGASILASVKTGQTANSYAANITDQGSSGLWNIASNLPLLATIVVAAVIIAILVVYLGGRLMGK